MANYRNISLSFWTDSKVDDDFTPEDKYFYLYLLTNPHTNICGCYEISSRQMERETGYNSDTIKRLIKRMVENHNVIRYSEETKEILILHWDKYNWSGSRNVETAVRSVINHIKNETFRKYILQKAEYRYNSKQYTETDTVSVTDTVTDGGIGYEYPIDTLSIPFQNTDDKANAPTPTPNKPKKQKFVPPTIEEVQAYCNETGKIIDAEYFVSYYGSQNWKKANGQPLSDWKLAVCQWYRKDKEKKPEEKPKTSYDLSQIEAQSLDLYKDLK